jgi:uncharacterized damage-inducible protein DinB
MSKAQGMLKLYKREAVGTRKALERVPFDKAEWAPHEKTDDLLATFDQGVSAIEAALADVTDEAWTEHWSLKSGGTEVAGGRRGAFFGSLVLNHVIHHRGQLTVYLRLLDIPVPALYGPSADEQ